MVKLDDIAAARARIGGALTQTPLEPAPDILGGAADVYLKLETMHRTGSFKERGALNKLLLLKESGRTRGVTTASAGNHAQAVAYHGARLGFEVTIFMPEQTALVKVAATRRWGADVHLCGSTFDEAMEAALEAARGRNLTFIHAFDDDAVIAGQGTVGLELLEQQPALGLAVIPVGGGGLAAGTAMALKEQKPSCRVVGVQSESHPFAVRAFKGEPAGLPRMPCPTIADGIAIKKPGERTLPMLKKYLDDMLTVSEEEIAAAVLHLLEASKLVAEGAGAAAVAALLANKVRGATGAVAAPVCGGNIDVNLLARIIEKGLLKSGRLVRLSVVIPDRPGGLRALAALLAEAGANILQIQHDRASTHLPLSTTGTDLTLETRGAEQIEEIVTALRAGGYTVSVRE